MVVLFLTLGLLLSWVVFCRSGVQISLSDMWSIVVFSSVSLFSVIVLKYMVGLLFGE